MVSIGWNEKEQSMFKESFQLSYLDLFLVSQIKRVVKLHNGILFTTPSNLPLHKKNPKQSKQNNQSPPLPQIKL